MLTTVLFQVLLDNNCPNHVLLLRTASCHVDRHRLYDVHQTGFIFIYIHLLIVNFTITFLLTKPANYKKPIMRNNKTPADVDNLQTRRTNPRVIEEYTTEQWLQSTRAY